MTIKYEKINGSDFWQGKWQEKEGDIDEISRIKLKYLYFLLNSKDFQWWWYTCSIIYLFIYRALSNVNKKLVLGRFFFKKT